MHRWGWDAWMGLGCVDGAWDMWMGPGTHGGGAEHASLLWWSIIPTVGMDAGGTRDMPVHVVHDEGEWQDTDKGRYTRQGMYAESLRVDTLGFCGWGVMAGKGHPWQGEGSGRANTIGKPFALCKVCTLITLVKHANSISPANVYEPGQ